MVKGLPRNTSERTTKGSSEVGGIKESPREPMRFFLRENRVAPACASMRILPIKTIVRTASSAEIHGEHLVFLHADGSLAALFLLELVESWSEIEF